jgi:hypothetical protein
LVLVLVTTLGLGVAITFGLVLVIPFGLSVVLTLTSFLVSLTLIDFLTIVFANSFLFTLIVDV